MARGSAVNEPIQSQAASDEFREGYERTFGDRPPQRGRWIWDEATGHLVRAEDYVPPAMARNADIMVDRFMEGQVTADGVDISSRAKRRRYMQEQGVADYNDFTQTRAKVQAEKAAKRRGEFKPDKQLRETIGRALYREKKIL